MCYVHENKSSVQLHACAEFIIHNFPKFSIKFSIFNLQYFFHDQSSLSFCKHYPCMVHLSMWNSNGIVNTVNASRMRLQFSVADFFHVTFFLHRFRTNLVASCTYYQFIKRTKWLNLSLPIPINPWATALKTYKTSSEIQDIVFADFENKDDGRNSIF